MKIFITGGSGFLGKAFIDRLIKSENYLQAPTSSQCDLLTPIPKSISNIAFDYILHLAVWTQAGDFCLYHQGEQWLNNQLINSNVLKWWQENQPQAKLIFMGTSCAYAPESDLLEEQYLQGNPIDELRSYAMTKRMLLEGALSLEKQYKMQYLCYVPSTLYGPNYHTDGRQMHFIFDLIKKIIRGKELGEEVVLWGDGLQCRELMYVEDFVSIAINLMNKVNNEIINIGAGEEHSIKHFAKIISEIVGYDANKIIYDTNKYVGAKSKCLNIKKLLSIAPKIKKTDLHEGLTKTIEWSYKTKVYL